MSEHSHAMYQVGVKALLWKNGRVLVLESPDGTIDFPGGRVDELERTFSWETSLLREIDEELGPDITIAVKDIAFVSKRAFRKAGTTHHIACIFYHAEYISGEVVLSEEHQSFDWIQPELLLEQAHRFVSQDEYEQYRAMYARL